MDSKSISRKDFITLTFTLIGSAAAVSCGSSSTNTDASGTGGTTGAAGTGGRAGGAGAGGTTGGAGAGGSGGAGGGAGTGASACTDPLPEKQDADANGHVHTVTVPAAMLSSTTDQTFTTSSAMSPGQAAHMHMVTLTAANLAAIKAGGTVDVMSTLVLSHLHAYTIGCTAV